MTPNRPDETPDDTSSGSPAETGRRPDGTRRKASKKKASKKKASRKKASGKKAWTPKKTKKASAGKKASAANERAGAEGPAETEERGRSVGGQEVTSARTAAGAAVRSGPREAAAGDGKVGAGGLHRVVVEGVEPEIDCGRFPVKRTVGERVEVEADAFTDGHDTLACVLLYRRRGARIWRETRMEALGNDRWRGSFRTAELGRYEYTVEAWIDRFETWRRDLRKRVDAGQDVEVDLRIGAELVREAAGRASGRAATDLGRWARLLEGTDDPEEGERVGAAFDDDLAAAMAERADRSRATRYGKVLEAVVDRERARFSAWYEMFPRSCGEGEEHGTFRDCEARLPYIAALGFDVLYLPPIHPVGRTKRKGRNNRPVAAPAEVGSPWAIGAEEGGHKAVHPELGTLEDFRRFRRKAEEHGLEVALDIAFQCSPDHPYVEEHPEWFRQRPDGTVQYAENPPKKYEDIYPFDFESDRWRELWEELASVFEFWIEQGVRIFRVDNPHTKPFPFWEWCIARIRSRHPEVIFLSEAFTRPRVMYRLAKLGFTQSYTYFAWRNAKWELIEYFTELTRTKVREFFRPNLWPNTPDILTEYLQTGGQPAFAARLVLAATLGASYGIYGPAFELLQGTPREPGSEEYLDSEKYQVRDWDLDDPASLEDLIARVNRIRSENPALHSDRRLRFHPVDNEHLIAYSKRSEDGSNLILTCVNLDPHHIQSGWLALRPEDVGTEPGESFQVHDLLGGDRYLWQAGRNYVALDPRATPAHVLRVRRRVRTERDFEYFI